jgi:hypothetical protein
VAWSFTIPRPDGNLSSTLAFLSETEYHYLEVRQKAGAALLGSQGDHYSAVWWYLDKQATLDILELPDDAASLFQAIEEYLRSSQRDDVCDGILALLKVLARFVAMYSLITGFDRKMRTVGIDGRCTYLRDWEAKSSRFESGVDIIQNRNARDFYVVSRSSLGFSTNFQLARSSTSLDSCTSSQSSLHCLARTRPTLA